jgi:hypothetical protein
LTPYQLEDVLLDYHTSQGKKDYFKGCEPVSKEGYDTDSKGLKDFLKCVQLKVQSFGWHRVITANKGNAVINLITNHGEITLEELHTYVSTYIQAQDQTRQNNTMIVTSLQASLSKAGRDKVNLWESDYKVDGIASAACLLKIIIHEARVDSHATAAKFSGC